MLFYLFVILLVVIALLGLVYVLPIVKVRTARPMKIYETIHSLPLIGKSAIADWYLSKIISLSAPYTASISPTIEVMSDEKTVISIREKYSMKNPFNSIHAAALVNLGDLVCGIQVTNQTGAKKLRAIPVEIKAEYPKKSRGKITATCETILTDVSEMQQVNGKPCINAIAELRDESGELTAKVTMLWSVAPIPDKKKD
ncbi:predicted protein [Naegleria gruberi]|uniref:Predicted protein n=1 Tax=Naegleria gruberi TaxID=5762 RepID=D2V9G0_NAEGR|nr:uncharacterized protein NAEGRDRAFT_65428 [Naegleria gruberi]EFC46453.1 predicted protein [Naegleria gruberi]|eukprot:XP_002679197.1 predicted protein [Naegleria gruberi strain NEG-M]